MPASHRAVHHQLGVADLYPPSHVTRLLFLFLSTPSTLALLRQDVPRIPAPPAPPPDTLPKCRAAYTQPVPGYTPGDFEDDSIWSKDCVGGLSRFISQFRQDCDFASFPALSRAELFETGKDVTWLYPRAEGYIAEPLGPAGAHDHPFPAAPMSATAITTIIVSATLPPPPPTPPPATTQTVISVQPEVITITWISVVNPTKTDSTTVEVTTTQTLMPQSLASGDPALGSYLSSMTSMMSELYSQGLTTMTSTPLPSGTSDPAMSSYMSSMQSYMSMMTESKASAIATGSLTGLASESAGNNSPTSIPMNDDQNTTMSISRGALAGIIIGIVLALASLGALCAFCIIRRRRRGRRPAKKLTGPSMLANSGGPVFGPNPMARSQNPFADNNAIDARDVPQIPRPQTGYGEGVIGAAVLAASRPTSVGSDQQFAAALAARDRSPSPIRPTSAERNPRNPFGDAHSSESASMQSGSIRNKDEEEARLKLVSQGKIPPLTETTELIPGIGAGMARAYAATGWRGSGQRNDAARSGSFDMARSSEERNERTRDWPFEPERDSIDRNEPARGRSFEIRRSSTKKSARSVKSARSDVSRPTSSKRSIKLARDAARYLEESSDDELPGNLNKLNTWLSQNRARERSVGATSRSSSVSSLGSRG